MNLAALWADTHKHLHANRRAAVCYIIFSVAVAAVYRLANYLVSGVVANGSEPLWLPGFRLVSLLWLAAGGAFVTAIFFAMMGKEIDRPLWKCSNWRDALRRFFIPWMIIFLVQVTVIDLLMRIPGGLLSVLMFDFLLHLLALPVGVCVMYFGRLDWSHLPETLGPIYSKFLMVLPVLAIMAVQWFLAMTADLTVPNDQPWGILCLLVYDGVLEFISCFAFVMMWRVCMINRDDGFSGRGNPFDF